MNLVGMSRFVVGTLLVLTAGIVLAAVVLPGSRQQELNGTDLGTASAPLDFTLTAHRGPVSLQDFRDQATVVFFGYTSCPDICPPTMARLARAMELLEDDAADVQVLLVTVDPAVDSPERLRSYVEAFDRRFVGLHGDSAAVSEVAGLFGAFTGQAPTGPAGNAQHAGAGDAGQHMAGTDHGDHAGMAVPDRVIGHSSHIFGLDRDGRYRVLWNADHTAAEIAADLRVVLGR